MVARIFSIVTIAIALFAIGFGAFQNRATEAVRIAVREHSPDGKAPQSGIRLRDRFAHDPVVIACAEMNASPTKNPEVRLFIVGAGENPIADRDLFRLSVPSAIVVAPKGRDATSVIHRANAYGSPVYLQELGHVTPEHISRDRVKFGAIAGYAGRNARSAMQGLIGSGLSFFDEQNASQAEQFRNAGIRFFGRTLTADNDEGGGYIAYMLKRAVTISRSCGAVNVLIRDTPSSLKAVRKTLNETQLGDAFTLPQ